LLKVLSKMNNLSIYNQSVELSWILIVSRHSHLNHLNLITWLDRNHVSVSFDCDTFTQNMICDQFFILNFLKKQSKKLKWRFLLFFIKKNKFSFLFVSCTRKQYLTVIEDYIKKNDVIVEINSHNLLTRDDHVIDLIWCDKSYSIFTTTRNWTNLSLINDFVKSSIIICFVNM
jgi:hypothetical protein